MAPITPGHTAAGGGLIVTDPDIGDTRTWTIVGGNTAHAPNYNFVANELKVTQSGSTVFDDTFATTVPPNGPGSLDTVGFPISAGVTYVDNGGTFSAVVNGGAAMNGANGATLTGSSFDPFSGQQAILNTTTPSTGRLLTTQSGFEFDKSFSVTGNFNLVIPQDARNGYGISLTDDLPGNPGTETVLLQVETTSSGMASVILSEVNDTTGFNQFLGSAPVFPFNFDTSTVNQIALTLTYTAPNGAVLGTPSAEPVVATFQLMEGANPVGQVQTFTIGGNTPTGTIFSSTENFTRAAIFGEAPTNSDTFLAGSYGTLDLTQSGIGPIRLAAVRPTCRLPSRPCMTNEIVTDFFQVQVADSHGATSTQTIAVSVTGTNDAPTWTNPNSATLDSVNEDTTNPAGELVRTCSPRSSATSTTTQALSGNPGRVRTPPIPRSRANGSIFRPMECGMTSERYRRTPRRWRSAPTR